MSEQEEILCADEQFAEENLDSQNESSSGVPNPGEKKIEDKVMTEVNGEIGFYLKKGTEFHPQTNFSVSCTGYVTENSKSDCPEGFLFNVVPKTTIIQGDDREEDIPSKSTQNYYLTWRAMSSQNGILNKFDSKKLWTVPSKEQYLPAYFKKLCDEYLSSSLARRVFPVECVGLQPNSDPPTWVIGSNLHVNLVGGVATRVPESLSPYAVLGSELAPLPIIDVKEDDQLDDGCALKEIIKVQHRLMGDNFVPALLVIGGMGLALHYEDLVSHYDGVPLVLAYGLPVSGKSLAVQIAMSLIGDDTSTGECTQAGIFKLSSSRTLPFWWDDVSDFSTLEALTVQTFNQSQRQTAKAEKAMQPRSIPLMTMNPQCVSRSKKKGENQKEKIARVFTRIATIPFEQISTVQTLQGSLELKASLQPLLKKAVLSIGTLIELRECFENMREDPVFHDICLNLEKSQLDMRSQLNYALLLFSTGKILEKLNLFDGHFDTVLAHFVEKILPTICALSVCDQEGNMSKGVEYSKKEEEDYWEMVEQIVEQASTHPLEAKKWFLPKSSVKSKCKCGDVFGFRAKEALLFIGHPEREQGLRRFVAATSRGCVGRLTFPEVGQCSGCIHVPRMQLSKETLKNMDEAFLNCKNMAGNSETEKVKAAMSKGGIDGGDATPICCGPWTGNVTITPTE